MCIRDRVSTQSTWEKPDEVERFFQWRKQTFLNALQDGVEPPKAALFASVCSHMMLMGVEYEPSLMDSAMKYCPADFQEHIAKIQGVHMQQEKKCQADNSS
eukprot:TRINITY_DN10494_c0_g1_i2.p1 TRINITY_DN10494_c0_g1~~TRINITY_DN10494_c0_g1_i2.p1  ORF type:complete len:101 (-),score=21.31 TRINITY_DN10494_c0_g1_i2:139-441(-)